jgi:hypothetical protein
MCKILHSEITTPTKAADKNKALSLVAEGLVVQVEDAYGTVMVPPQLVPPLKQIEAA